MAKTILITGSSSGIGKAAVLLFQKNGWNVIATMRSPQKEKELSQLDNTLVTFLDVTKPQSIQNAIEEGIQKFSGIDVLVNNAGYGLMGPFETINDEQLKKEIDTNVVGVIQVTKAIVPYFRKRKQGTIINIASMGGRFTFPLYSIYHASKWAVEGFSESLQHELIQFNIRVKIIEPGTIRTDFYDRSLDIAKIEQPYKAYTDKTMPYMQSAGKTGSSPEEVAEIIYKAANDNNWKLRYPVGKNAKLGLFLRKILPDGVFNKCLRFAVEHNIPL